MPRVGESDYCWNHSPELAADRAKARRRGGRATRYAAGGKRESVSFATADDIRAELERVYVDTLGQANSPQRSRTLGYLLGFATELLKVGVHEQRIAALEAQVGQGPRRFA
jgi:hypothetical protein